MPLKKLFLKYFMLLSFFTLCFIGGNVTAQLSSSLPGSTIATRFLPSSESWGLSFQQEGEQPVGNSSIEELKTYRAYYVQETEEKILYLTFDCGYENGNTEAILDALKSHNAPAAFFIVGNYLSTNPELVKRMHSEGHIIGNHSYHHPDMTQLSSSDFRKELTDLSSLYEKVIGDPIDPYYRPPQGKYNTETLQQAKDLGYSTIFWSLAYVDWYEDDQPSKSEAFDKLLNRIHPGAIVLLHNTSSTNAAILDELLEKWETMGYRFGSLSELTDT